MSIAVDQHCIVYYTLILEFHSSFIFAIVRRFSREKIAPKVAEMDRTSIMNKEIIQGLFDQGVLTENMCKYGSLNIAIVYDTQFIALFIVHSSIYAYVD